MALSPVTAELKANITEFSAKMNEARHELSKTSEHGKTNFNKVAAFGKQAFLGLSAAAIGFGVVAVKEALAGEAAHAQMINAIKNSGAAVGPVVEKVEVLSKHFEKLGFTNVELEGAFGRLTRMTGNTSVALKDMAVTADVARVKHIGLEQAAMLVGKVANGNTKVLKQMGLATKDAAGNALTAAQGMSELTKSVSGAAQAQASTFAGKIAALHAEITNLVEKVGNFLIPKLQVLASASVTAIGYLEKHRAAAAAAAAVIGGPLVLALSAFIAKQAVAFGVRTVNQIGSIIAGVTKLGGKVALAAESEALFNHMTLTGIGALGGIGLALGAVTYGVMHFVEQQRKAKEEVKAFTDAIKQDNGALGDNVRALLLKNFQDHNQIDDLRAAKVHIDDVTKALDAGTSAIYRHNKSLVTQAFYERDQAGGEARIIELLGGSSNAYDKLLVRLAKAGQLNRGLFNNLQKQHGELHKGIQANKDLAAVTEKTTEKTGGQAKAVHNLTTELGSYKTAQDNAKKSIDAYQLALDALINPDIAVREANLDLTDSVLALTKATKEKISKDITAAQKAEDIQRATDAMVLSTEKAVTAQVHANQIGGDFNSQNQRQIELLQEQANHAIPAVKTQLEGMITTLKNIPSYKAFTIRVKKDQAEAALQNFREHLKTAFSNLTVDFAGNTTAAGFRLHSIVSGFRASGGPVSANKAYVVGEKHAEVFVPRTDGNIVPSLKGMGGGYVDNSRMVVNINGYNRDPDDIIGEIRNAFVKLKRSGFNLGLT